MLETVEKMSPKLPPQGDEVCCLCWVLNEYEQTVVLDSTLVNCHKQVSALCEAFGTQLISDDATSGLVRSDVDGADMSMSDAAVRMGQLLCRWAATQSPPVGMRVGIHIGQLRRFPLPNSQGRTGYFGNAASEARRLAEAGEDLMVHLSKRVKDRLKLLRMTRLIISQGVKRGDAYLLDPSTEITRHKVEPGGNALGETEDIDVVGRLEAQHIKEFERYLVRHGVDVSKFGMDIAKTIGQFYRSVIVEKRSFFVERDGKLERVVSFVQVTLKVIDIQEGEDNTMLALMLRVPESGWQDAIDSCFLEKFKISIADQRRLFRVDASKCDTLENRCVSDMLPGVMTLFKLQRVVIEAERSRQELREFGLTEGHGLGLQVNINEHWHWTPLGNKKQGELMRLLLSHGVDVSDFSPNAFDDLYAEIYEKQQSSLAEEDDVLFRQIQIVKVWLIAEILNFDHVLVTKAKMQGGKTDEADLGRPISMRMGPDQEWQDATLTALRLRLGIPANVKMTEFDVDETSHTVTEEIMFSRSYPGLKTIYEVNEVRVRVVNPRKPEMTFLGLPAGTDFTVARTSDHGDVVVTQWGWRCLHGPGISLKSLTATAHLIKPSVQLPQMSDDVVGVESQEVHAMSSVTPTSGKRRKVQSPKALVRKGKTGSLSLEQFIRGKKTDWMRAHQAASRIRDPNYTCKDFFEDITSAFPELRLYCATDEGEEEKVSGGRTGDDEYQRTIGALFAVFWLMRMDIDGKEGFTFGLDDSWRSRTRSECERDMDKSTFEKRANFYDQTQWSVLKDLLHEAGLLKSDGGHDERRVLSMLVLMAIHDIMKMAVLLPTVAENIGAFNGYTTGEVVSDHDIALSYILQHHAEILPSYTGLPKEQQDTIKFTHCKLDYNMGWLVQAEAPPAALFRTFRKVVIEGKAEASDIAFYFVHWFADLAGAEPFPLEGSEKFVLKFPQKVLEKFVRSFSIVQKLSAKTTETAVFEDYLQHRWQQHEPSLGPLPSGPGSIAMMRVILMAQGDSKAVLGALEGLASGSREVICQEMAVTGCVGQSYQRDTLQGTALHLKGPAILVYYSPALLQKAGKTDPGGALEILAEVFRGARVLWPLAHDQADKVIIVRIDALKELEVADIMNPKPGMSFVLVKDSGQDASVKLKDISTFGGLDWSANQVLTFTKKSPVKKRHRASTANSTEMLKRSLTVGSFSLFKLPRAKS